MEINRANYFAYLSKRCAKEKHKIRENSFGICWCTICGKLVSPKDYSKFESDDQLIVK